MSNGGLGLLCEEWVKRVEKGERNLTGAKVMHQKKSEVQIGKESSGVSSDFNPIIINDGNRPIASASTSPAAVAAGGKTTAHKRILPGNNSSNSSINSMTKSPTLSNSLHKYPFYSAPPSANGPSFPIKLPLSSHVSRRPLPVSWSIGSWPKYDKKVSSGCWVQAYSNGDVYEGEFHKGKCNGSGVYYYYMSGRFEGDWVDGKYDGHGVETWARGSQYRGQYRQGLRHGFGVYRFYTGDVYAGEWSNGQGHGCGVHTCEDGSRYVGEFKNSDTYAGEYFADKMHGFGVYHFANGHRFEGAWHEGRRQGLGTYTFRNGETQSGHWHNGILDIPSTQSVPYPGSPVAVYHSKVLNAVQEARQAAEKAYNVAKVDERVNRTVAAANKAANAARVAAVKAVQKEMHHRRNSDELPIPVM
nr:Phosphatidylinositol 4-phosphate 5-kinase [Ipomoea batatas]GMD71662.1 Phosphatidylinositol 4-phosphate 5-kinase [Ipomoea batatas]